MAQAPPAVRTQRGNERSSVLGPIHGLVTRRAKNPTETRALMLELDERARRVEEMTESPPDERHVMSVIMGILDSETLKHTIHFQGMKKSVSELRHKVMEFVNLIQGRSDGPGA